MSKLRMTLQKIREVASNSGPAKSEREGQIYTTLQALPAVHEQLGLNEVMLRLAQIAPMLNIRRHNHLHQLTELAIKLIKDDIDYNLL